MLLDLRFAIRLLLKNPAFTMVAVLTLGLAVAANTVVFSVVNAILIRPLHFAEPSRLVQLNTQYPGEFEGYWQFSAPEYAELSRDAHAFESVGAYAEQSANLTGGDKPVSVRAVYATASLLPTLGVAPMLGRTFDASEDVPGDPVASFSGLGGTHVVVLSYDLFNTVFGGDKNIVGRTVRVDAMPVTVVGVMPRGFDYPNRTQMWLPAGIDMPKMRRNTHWFPIIGRLKPGTSLEAARAEMSLLMQTWKEEHRGEHAINGTGHTVALRPLQEALVTNTRLSLLTLQGAVLFVMLIACANISNLLLARAEARSGEIAVRAALGASIPRMARQFLTESMVLGAAGAAVGIVLAMWGLDAVLALLPEGVPRAGEVHLDASVLIFAVVVALSVSFLFGLTPILHARADLAKTLRAAGQRTATSGRGKRLFQRALILAQIALAVVLVTGAGLMIRSFAHLQTTELGYDPRGMLTLNLQLPKTSYPTDEDAYNFWQRLREGAANLPGATSASLAVGLPPLRDIDSNSFNIVGRVLPPGLKDWNVDYWQIATNDYFSTMKIPLLRGRLFDANDHEHAPKVVVINEAFAKKFFPGEDPIGQRVNLSSLYRPGDVRIEQTIVGIVADVKQAGVDAKPGTEVYIPVQQTLTWYHWIPGQSYMPRSMYLILRTDGDPRALAPTVRAFIGSRDAGLPIAQLATMDRVIYDAIAKPRFITTLLGFFAGLALTMAAIGIYGVMSYAFEQRTKELSIRMALGADAGRLQKMLLFEGLRMAAIGIGCGLLVVVAVAVGFGSWIAGLLFEIGGLDPATYVLVILITFGAAALASYLPARRATLVHPMTAMRHE